jgi:putative CocE/NonD family hydrolase
VRLAQAGYIVVIQDVRGRFASDGEFNPDFQEIEDGYDAVEWASHLPGSNGVVGMYGRSYHAETQWAAARNRPPALKSIVPGLSPIDSILNGFFLRGGAHELGSRISWANRQGLDTLRRAARGQDDATLQRLLRQQAEWDREVNTGEIYWRLPLSSFTSEHAPALTRLACQTFRTSVDDRSW